MILESKYQRRIRLRIDDLIDELERPLTYEEVKIEFEKRGFRRPFKKVVIGILEEMEKKLLSRMGTLEVKNQ